MTQSQIELREASPADNRDALLDLLASIVARVAAERAATPDHALQSAHERKAA